MHRLALRNITALHMELFSRNDNQPLGYVLEVNLLERLEFMDPWQWRSGKLFPLSSIEPDGISPGSDPTRVEAGFIGAHSDIGGGYSDGDLSDVALQWMIEQAEKAGVNMLPLSDEHKTVSNPIVHDERWGLTQFINGDRIIEYPNDPTWQAAQQSADSYTGEPTTDNDFSWQQNHPDYQAVQQFIRDDNTVDMTAYSQWLQQHRGISVNY